MKYSKALNRAQYEGYTVVKTSAYTEDIGDHLDKLYGPDPGVHTIEDDGVIQVYLKTTGSPGYITIGGELYATLHRPKLEPPQIFKDVDSLIYFLTHGNKGEAFKRYPILTEAAPYLEVVINHIDIGDHYTEIRVYDGDLRVAAPLTVHGRIKWEEWGTI